MPTRKAMMRHPGKVGGGVQSLNLVSGVLNSVEGEKTRRRHFLGADFIRFWFGEVETLILFKKPCCI